MSHFVNALAIRRWADRMEARSKLPVLLRRLVMSTVEKLVKVDFPADESVQRSGYDGEVDCQIGNAWVPDGRSVWELGVSKDVKGKADDDFEKRTKEATSEERASEAFIFVTPRHWENKDDWAQKQTATGDWKEVRAYDADDIEQWLDASPSVAVWFGRLIGSRPIGVDDIEVRWSSLANCASQQLLPSVFLAGLEDNVTSLFECLSADPQGVTITSRSPVEVIYFVCAAIASLGEDDRIAVEARSIIVESVDAWRILRDSVTPAILIVDPAVPVAGEDVARAVSHGHHVVIAAEPAISNPNGFALNRSKEFELTKALEESGFEPVRAAQIARSAGGSLAVLKTRLERSTPKPDWIKDRNFGVVSACLLLGGWDGSNESDRQAFERLSSKTYEECESELQKMATCRDPLLHHAAGKWRLISKDHAWSILNDCVSASSIREFRKLAVAILADDDPRFELPEDQRPYSAIHGHVPQYSDTVKRHVSETLALLGEFGAQFQAASSTDISSAVDGIVLDVLPLGCSWQRWASLGSRLPLLAEASPSSFLQAVRTDLSSAEPQLPQLLHEEDDFLFGRCNHAGLLWALETLAWSRQHLAEAVTTLLSLSKLDAGGKWSNRPVNSLCEIFSNWIPHTSASLEERVKLIELMIRHDEDAAWPILIKLLVGKTTSSSTHRPYWRDWANQWMRGVSRSESTEFTAAVAARILDHVGTNAERWRDVVERVGNIPSTLRQQLVEQAREFAGGSELPDEGRRIVADELSKQINLNRSFPDARWSLPSETLDDLEEVLQLLKPRDAVLRNAWLFEAYPHRFFRAATDLSEGQQTLDDARIVAIKDVLNSSDFQGVESLARIADAPYFVGRALHMAVGDEHANLILPAKLRGDEKDRDFAAGVIDCLFDVGGWQWLDETLAICESADEQAWLLSKLRFGAEVWERAERSGDEVARLYWQRCRAFNPQLEGGDVEVAVSRLLDHGRPAPTIDLLTMALHNQREIQPEMLLRPLEVLATLSPDEAEKQGGTMMEHGIPQIIEHLQDRDDVDADRMAGVEWLYLEVLDEHMGRVPRTLYAQVTTSPAFFNRLLEYAFRPRDEDESERPEFTAHDLLVAQNAARLLLQCSVIPGTDEDGNIDESALRQWCIEARNMAKESGRQEICEDMIGQLLAHSPDDEDGTWPCTVVRRVAEELKSDDFRSGMYSGIINSRGAVFRASGGQQEQELANQYRANADRIRFESPFVASILDAVADTYTREARWWDERDRWEDQ